MKLKTLGICMMSAFIITGCSSPDNTNVEETFTLSEQRETVYAETIENTLNSFYWRYDGDSITFTEGEIPTDSSILKCSLDSGYDLSKNKGDKCAIATADLLYFNREVAGKIYFYFISDSLKGLYYIPDALAQPCSLYVRNSYYSNTPFKSLEDNKASEYISKSITGFNAAGILDSVTIDGTTYSIFDSETKLIINKSTSSGPLYTYRTLDMLSDELIPVSAVFINDSTEMAVLYGTEIYSSSDAVPMFVPKKIVIYDSNFNPAQSIDISEDNDCYALGYDNGCLLVARDKSIDFYTINGTEIIPKQVSYYIGKSITGIEIDDLDNDGETEYIFTDGQDLYIYHKTISVFKCIWSTHLSIESFEKYIYTGDLNNDSVQEIYVFDSTGTTSKYIVGENGIYTQNDDIDYGQRYHIADFNADGIDDSLIMGNSDLNSLELRLTKK